MTDEIAAAYEKEAIFQISRVLDLHGAMTRPELEELLVAMIMQAFSAGAVHGIDRAREILGQVIDKTIEKAIMKQGETEKWPMN